MKPIHSFYRRFCRETFDEDHQLVGFDLHYPDNFNYGYDVVDQLAEEYPYEPALQWCNSAGAHHTFSFAQIRDLSNKAANVLKERGIGRGDRVMLILKRHYEYWYLSIALHKLGAVMIPATNMLTVKDILYRIRRADIRAIICTADGNIPEFVELAADQCKRPPALYIVRSTRRGFFPLAEAIDAASPEFPRQETAAGDPMLLYFTSGTTGEAKAVLHDFTYPLGHILTAKYWQCVQDGDLHLTVAETGWGKTSWGKIYGQWLCGTAVFVYDFDRFAVRDLLSKIVEYKVTTFCAPPTVYRYLIKEDLSAWDLSAIRHVSTAGEALNYEIYKIFKDKTGLEIKEGFGQTETTLMLGNLGDRGNRPGSMGLPSPAYNIRLVDDNDQFIDIPGVTGEIVVVPPTGQKQVGLFTGYIGEDELYAHVWRGGIYHTGDTACFDKDGYLWYVGRNDDIIKSSGYRIGPFEIESCLMESPAVLECAVTGIPSRSRGAVVKATVVPAPGYAPTDALARSLQQFVQKHIAAYKHPRILEFVDELPKTISGKILRSAIRARDKEKYGIVK